MQARAAKALTTKNEYAVIQKASPTHIGKLTPAQLRKGLAAARRLRQKAIDLAARQKRESRGKAAPRSRRPAAPGENTQKKLELFAQAVERYGAALNKAGEAKPRASKAGTKRAKAGKTAGKKVEMTAGRKVARGAAGPVKPPRSASRRSKPASTIFAAGSAPVEFDGMGQGGSLGAVRSRNTALRTRSKLAQPSRRANLLAGTPNSRIRGHMSAATRRAQAKRDSK